MLRSSDGSAWTALASGVDRSITIWHKDGMAA